MPKVLIPILISFNLPGYPQCPYEPYLYADIFSGVRILFHLRISFPNLFTCHPPNRGALTARRSILGMQEGMFDFSSPVPQL